MFGASCSSKSNPGIVFEIAPEWQHFIWSVFQHQLLESNGGQKDTSDGCLVICVPNVLSLLAFVYCVSDNRSLVAWKNVLGEKVGEASDKLRTWEMELTQESEMGWYFFRRARRVMLDAHKSNSFGTETRDSLHKLNVELTLFNEKRFSRKEIIDELHYWIKDRCFLPKLSPNPPPTFFTFDLEELKKQKLLAFLSLSRVQFTLHPDAVLSKCWIDFHSFSQDAKKVTPTRAVRLRPIPNNKRFNAVSHNRFWRLIELPLAGTRIKGFVLASAGDIPISRKQEMESLDFGQISKNIKNLMKKENCNSTNEENLLRLVIPEIAFVPKFSLDLRESFEALGLQKMFTETILCDFAPDGKIYAVQHASLLSFRCGFDGESESTPHSSLPEEDSEKEDMEITINSPFYIILWDKMRNGPVMFARFGDAGKHSYNQWRRTGQSETKGNIMRIASQILIGKSDSSTKRSLETTQSSQTDFTNAEFTNTSSMAKPKKSDWACPIL